MRPARATRIHNLLQNSERAGRKNCAKLWPCHPQFQRLTRTPINKLLEYFVRHFADRAVWLGMAGTEHQRPKEIWVSRKSAQTLIKNNERRDPVAISRKPS